MVRRIDRILSNLLDPRRIGFTSRCVPPTYMKEKRPINPWSLSSEGLQLVITLLMGVFIGMQLDKRFGTQYWYTIGGALLGIVAGLYNFLKRFL